MMKGFKYACFSVLSLALLSACSMNQSSESSMDNQTTMNTTTNKNPLVGKDASNFELKDMKGNTVKLSDYKGKKLYLKFWATWCGPCRQRRPELEKLVKDTDRDFEILTIMAPGLQGEKTEEEFVKWFLQEPLEKKFLSVFSYSYHSPLSCFKRSVNLSLRSILALNLSSRVIVFL